MSRNTKIFIWLIVFAYIVMPIAGDFIETFLNNEESTGFNDYARITDVDYQAVLIDEPNESGKLIITETLTYDIHAASKDNLFWELWRDLPEDYVDGLKVDYKVNYVKQINKDGSQTVYTESPKLYWEDYDYTSSIYGPGKWYHSKGPYDEDLANYECVFFYVDGLYREQVTFEIQYEMNNAALRYGDVSELYISMYSEDTIKHLNSFKGKILIPNKDMPSKGNYLAHTYGTNSNSFKFTESSNKNPGYYTFSINLDKDDLKFKKYNEYLEFSLLSYNDDKHIFTDYAPYNYYYDDNYLDEVLENIKKYDNMPIEARNTKTAILIISIICSILIGTFVITRDKRIKKKYIFYKPSTQFDYFREIPSDIDPYFASKLLFSKKKHKIDMGDIYASIMLNLVRKGYIELKRIDNTKDWKPNNILIKILYNDFTSDFMFNNITSDIINNDLNGFINNELRNDINTIINDSLFKNFTLNEVDNYNTNEKKLEDLSINEKNYFNLIVKYSNNNSITLKEFQNKINKDYDNTDTFVTSVENSIVNIGVSNSYFQKADYLEVKNKTNKLAKTYFITALILIIVCNLIIYSTRLDLAFGSFFIVGFTLIISSIYLKKKSNEYILLTQNGEDEYIKWLGLYKFLNDGTLMKEKSVIELPLWEKYLVYATAFGISEKVIKAIEVNCPNKTDSAMLNNEYYRSRNFRINNHSFGRSTHHASRMSRSFSSSGSYYGGGGRGGGGGGGGH